MDLALGDLYSEKALANGVTTEKADLLFASLPYRILPEAQIPVYAEMARRDADFYSQLEAAGFHLDFGVDGSGLFLKYLRRGSGYYIDVGASQLIIDGRVKLANGGGQQDHRQLRRDGQRDGTGCRRHHLRHRLWFDERLVGAIWSRPRWPTPSASAGASDRTRPRIRARGRGNCATCGSQPEPGLWIHGGNLHQCRHYSLLLALQLKARMEGIDTPVYKLADVHHTS